MEFGERLLFWTVHIPSLNRSFDHLIRSFHFEPGSRHGLTANESVSPGCVDYSCTSVFGLFVVFMSFMFFRFALFTYGPFCLFRHAESLRTLACSDNNGLKLSTSDT